MAKRTLLLALSVSVVALSGCTAGSSSSPGTIPVTKTAPLTRYASGSTPIQHIVLVVQENRTMNNLFATFPGVTGSTVAKELLSGHDVTINLKKTKLSGQRNLNHNYSGFLTAYNSGKLDAFNLVVFPNGSRTENNAAYVYVNPVYITPYWQMAEQWGLANAMFATQGSASFTAHQDLIRGGTNIDSSHSLIDNLPYHGAWGCDSAPGTKTTVITTDLKVQRAGGPFPCTTSFPYAGTQYPTLRDLLDARYVSWKYYTPALGTAGQIWNAFDVISSVRNGPEWGTNVTWPETNFFNDVTNGTLPAMSWVIPHGANSDHPNNNTDTGPSWVASIVNAIGQSQYWNSTAIIVTWDDWGGFYDPVPPPLPRDNQGGPGLRVPLLVISPYTKIGSGSQGGYISNTFYEFGSIVRFIEDTFTLGRLGTTDVTSNSIDDMFDFNQSPRSFSQIGSKYSRSYFMHQHPPNVPVDTE